MSKYTPGPWAIDEGHDGTTAGIYGPNTDGHRAGVEVCTVWGPERNVFTARANAALIAAAPELLEALKECHEALLKLPMAMQPDAADHDISLSGYLRGLIAKAEGRS